MSEPPAAGPKRILNVNVGVLGHVDSGKTSLVAALSTRLSTAALDKHPQSKERGITLDLGFSSFTAPLPAHLGHLPYDELQFTLVDCPGHASLIRTIMGGAQIIDAMILVVDVCKGIQAQTAECLVVGEIATDQLLVVVNKTDLLPEAQRDKLVQRAKKRLAASFAATKFGARVAMVAVAAKPGGGDGPSSAAVGIGAVAEELARMVPGVRRGGTGPFLFAVDHCFAVRGQGTVLTGTVLSGAAKVGDTVELPGLRIQKKIKSMQMFRAPVQRCQQGDRVGLCMTQLDAGIIERGLACGPGSVPTFQAAIAAVEKIRFFTGVVPSKSKMHVTAGHATVMAEASFFGTPDCQGGEHGRSGSDAPGTATSRVAALASKDMPPPFNLDADYLYQDRLYGLEGRAHDDGTSGDAASDHNVHHGPQWALLKFVQPVTASQTALIIASRLDADNGGATCRLAFYGRIIHVLNTADPAQLAKLRVFKLKERLGTVERPARDGLSAVCKGMFKKETDLSLFAGMKVTASNGATGVIESAFGKSGKFRVAFPDGLGPRSGAEPLGLLLRFKRYVFDPSKRRMVQ